MKKLRAQKGITLIALVITIIVMLILVGVSVTVALNGGLFTTAKEAAEGTASKRNEELNLSDGKVEINGERYNSIDEYVNGGDSNNPEEPENPTGYAAYSVGDIVTIGTENFYVLKDSDAAQEKVTLLTKDNIDITNLVQSESAETVAFSTEQYWEEDGDIKEEIIPIPDSHIAAKAAYDYGAKVGGTGRLMTEAEKTALQTANSDILYGRNGKSSSTYLNYWLASGGATGNMINVLGYDSYIGNSMPYNVADYCGVRPVVEISKANIS